MQEIIELLVWYAPILKELISQPEGSVKYAVKTAFCKTTYFCFSFISVFVNMYWVCMWPNPAT